MIKYRFLIFCWCGSLTAAAQAKLVAITMDDVPFNAMPSRYTVEQVKAAGKTLLEKITQQQTPVTIFINGDACMSPEKAAERWETLRSWVNHPLITPANHSLRHLNCGEMPLAQFREEVSINDYIIRKVWGDKPLHYFRFPFNNQGKDSAAQAERLQYLQDKGYTAAPFTVESADYMYAALYDAALAKKDKAGAAALVKEYIRSTLAGFAFAEQLSQEQFGRNIPQIYLCHANQLHTDHYGELIAALRERGYQFISMEAAMQDTAYASPVYYYGPYGFSWLFRWIKDAAVRKQYLRNSPDANAKIYSAYEQLSH
ncbi:polysaccharide deacetylase family protein [Chitinophaga sp. Mgbs1]|uniref:Polysaccharide deacetylase family protein n=1 Tax=Chitinophaga solisilvae TaxID=1233460 RepID=A0A433WLE6_9BACT|nr:polysaccharide deacetylase family protein [Chitinophaga solisilvae]